MSNLPPQVALARSRLIIASMRRENSITHLVVVGCLVGAIALAGIAYAERKYGMFFSEIIRTSLRAAFVALAGSLE
jgi:hypothetical protein